MLPPKAGRPLLAVSTCCLADAPISEWVYALFRRHHVMAVEIAPGHVPPAMSDPGHRAELVALARHNTPPVFSLHAPFRPGHDLSVLDEGARMAAVARIEEEMELAGHLGAQLVVIHASWDPIAPDERPQRCAQARRSLARLVEKARRVPVRLALETQTAGYLPAGMDEAGHLLDGLDPEVIGYCLDANHSNLTVGLPAAVRELSPRLWNIHLSDNDGARERHWMPFQGVIDWPEFMALLDGVHYTGPLTYELAPHSEGVERCLAEVEETYARLLSFVSG